jgi:glyceraldehyde 3-phosphate dehydrogenase
MAPSSTGAAKAVAEVYPALRGLFDGVAIRVPVASGSLADITFIAKRETTVAEVNGALSAAAQDSRWSETFAVTDEPIVSSDVLGLPYGSIVDLTMTRVVGGNLVKVLAWYDNEMGYAATLVRHVIQSAQPPRETV